MLLSLVAHAADAAETFPDASTTANDAAATASAAVGVGILGGLMVLWIILGLIGLLFFIWWIILLMDLSKRDFPQKSTYMILMIVSFFLGFIWIMDLVYYFGIVRKGVGKAA